MSTNTFAYKGYTGDQNSHVNCVNFEHFTDHESQITPFAFIDIGHKARVLSPRCGNWVESRVSFLALPRVSEDNLGNFNWA